MNKINCREEIKLISLLLEYPNEEIQNLVRNASIDEILDSELSKVLNTFWDYFKKTPLEQLQENYVHTFDFNEQTNLYLTYANLGEEKERGQLLAELKMRYEQAGLVISSTELPDYLPLFLEFVSQADSKTSLTLLTRFRNAIVQKQQALADLKSPYAHVLQGLLLIIEHTISKGDL